MDDRGAIVPKTGSKTKSRWHVIKANYIYGFISTMIYCFTRGPDPDNFAGDMKNKADADKPQTAWCLLDLPRRYNPLSFWLAYPLLLFAKELFGSEICFRSVMKDVPGKYMDRLKQQSLSHGVYSRSCLVSLVHTKPEFMGGLLLDTFVLTHFLTLAIGHDFQNNGRSSAKKAIGDTYHFLEAEEEHCKSMLSDRRPIQIILDTAIFELQPLRIFKVLEKSQDNHQYDPDDD
jgi:hypothetical protein